MKKTIALILVFALMLIMAVPVLAVENNELTYLYLDKGNITIGDGTVKGYGYHGQEVTTANAKGYIITQTTTNAIKNTITFNGGKNYVVFSNLKVSLSSQFSCCAFLTNNADVTINIQNTNVLVSGASRAGIEVDIGSAVTIEGTGRLMAGSSGQAGIGGGNGRSNGSVTINSGTVVAQSVSNGAGIGGGSTGNGGTITINGGNVTAVGGDSGAGIGGGSTGDGGTITINGGTVTATGGANGAGIGGGWYGEMGDVIINAGSVKATAGSGANKIGTGAGAATSKSIVNASGEMLSLFTLESSSVSNIKQIYVNSVTNNINSYHSGDTKFYFYLPKHTHIICADSDTSITGFWRVDYSNAFTYSQINPIQMKNSATVGADDVIRGISFGLNSLDDYITLLSGFSLEYSQDVIGTGTQIYLIYDDDVIFTYTALLYGDLDNSGYYDGEDSFIALLMQWGNLNSTNTLPYVLEAADINRNGSVDGTDIETLQKAGLLLSRIPQNDDQTLNTDSDEWVEYVSLIEQAPENYEETTLFDKIIEFLQKIYSLILSLINSIKA